MENQERADEEMSFKQVTNANPFTVPSGYFEEAGQRIGAIARLQNFKSADDAQGFTVPPNYFNELSIKIQSRINLEGVTSREAGGFALPAGYFEQLTNTIQSRVNIDAAVNAAKTGFTIPEGYFNDLAGQVSARIAVEEVLAINSGTFTVPENYFEKLNKNILNKTVNQDRIIRKTIVRKLFGNNTFKYATAACLALVIGAGLIIRQSAAPEKHDHTFLHSQLAGVPVNEIKDYLELHTDAAETQADINDKISTQALDNELQDYIDVN